MNYSGMTSSLALALAATGVMFPFFSAFIGMLGVFVTGSDRRGRCAGDPIEDSNDLFGATVQKAARICQGATPEGIVVSEAVRTRIPARHEVTQLGARMLKGFGEAVPLYEVAWR